MHGSLYYVSLFSNDASYDKLQIIIIIIIGYNAQHNYKNKQAFVVGTCILYYYVN